MPDLDPVWITAALRRSLRCDATADVVEQTSIGTGQVGENVRLTLSWTADSPDLPASVVVKLPSTSEISRATAVQLDTYTKEVGFYRDLQAHVAIRTPVVHALAWDPETHDFALVMEDIAPASQGDQVAGCTVDQARLAVDQAIGLHGPSWGRRALWGEHDWIAGPGVADDAALRVRMFELLTPGFVDRYRDRLAAADLAVVAPLTAAFEHWNDLVVGWGAQHGWSLVHGDYRLDNMLFGEPPASPPLTVVDWQTVGVGVGPFDVAYFVGAGLLPVDRRPHERELVMRYASGVRGHGVEISDEAAWEGYVLGSISGLYMAVLASQIVERTERGDEMFAVMAERHIAQVRDVGLAQRLGVD